MNYKIKEVHISEIVAGDTILHIDGHIRTVCKNNIKRGGFMGTTIFGDAYGLQKGMVQKIEFIVPSIRKNNYEK